MPQNLHSVLIKLKHHHPWIWRAIEAVNAGILRLTAGRTLARIRANTGPAPAGAGYLRLLTPADLDDLTALLARVTEKEKRFFRPHGFDRPSLRRVLGSAGFLPYGYFINDELCGYCFLRLFANRKAFLGRYLRQDCRGNRTGGRMIDFLCEIGREARFRVYSTISRKNIAVVKSHEAAGRTTVIKDLENDYILVELAEVKGKRIRRNN